MSSGSCQTTPEQFEHYFAEVERIRETYITDTDDYVRLEDVSVYELNSTAQYTGRFISGINGTPKLADDLDIKGNPDEFTSVRIKVDSVPIFLGRIAQYKEEKQAALLAKLDN